MTIYTIIENRFNTDSKEKFKGNFKRFLDDCFLIWNPDDGNITDLMNMLNNLHIDLKFTTEQSPNEIAFLDVKIIKMDTKVVTDVYHKPTDAKQYLNFYSCHAAHTKRALPYNLARRICTTDTLFSVYMICFKGT